MRVEVLGLRFKSVGLRFTGGGFGVKVRARVRVRVRMRVRVGGSVGVSFVRKNCSEVKTALRPNQVCCDAHYACVGGLGCG